jgi:serine/threonine protein kinase
MFGERLGKWTLSTEIGRGGMGRVFLATEDMTGRQGAVKILSAELAADPGFLSRFQREVEALSQLDHPHIVQFFESGHDAGKYYYAMEYVPGQSLEEVVDHKKRMNWKDVLDIALQVCPALKHVHDHGIVHRDLKLSNILIRDDGIVKLTDFGIAKVFATTDLTQTGGVVGTAEYLSPEQAMGKPVTKKSDIYSLGVVFYAMLTGRLPFDGKSYLDLMHKHRYAQFDKPGKIVPDLPYEIDEVICQMMEKDPAKRPADCLVLAKTLDSIRRKFERKDQGTRISESETVVQTKPVFDPKTVPGPITLAERAGRGRDDQRGLIGRFFNHPIVVATLLALVVGTIVYTFNRPINESETVTTGLALMASDRLSDKEAAWNDHLEPVLRRNPETPFKEVIEQAKRRLDLARNPDASEANRWLAIAKKRSEAGDDVGAVAIYGRILEAFEGIEAEKDAVAEARNDLNRLTGREAQEERLRRVRPILDRAADLNAKGKRADAERIWSALEQLYRDDPAGGMVLVAIAVARK